MSKSEDDGLRFDAFQEARARLRADFSGRSEAQFLSKWLSPATISRLKKSDIEYPSERFEASIQNRLIWGLQQRKQGATLYAQLGALIDQSAGDRETILSDYLGEFRYFRYASKGTINDIKYVWGRIRISADTAGDPIFEHWSHDHPDDEPEHTGFVYHFENRIYMAGTARGIMRLGIGRTLTKHKSKSCIPGLIVSVRNDPLRDPYSARFIMVHMSNTALIKKLSDQDPVDDHSAASPSPDGKRKTKGEAAFAELSKAPYAWYLLTH